MTSSSRRRTALVITVVHDPRDSRIWFRQIDTLINNGWSVTYAAPISGDRRPVVRPGSESGEVRLVNLPRAAGRSRIRALVAARRLLKRVAGAYDVVLIHDPELLLATVRLELPNLVWDVHEDTAAALPYKHWLPAVLRPVTGRAIRSIEQWAESRFNLMLAESSYQARFRKRHPVVPNTVTVPEKILPGARDRVVYLGSITAARGGDLLPQVGSLLRDRTHGEVVLEVIGPTYDEPTRRAMSAAAAEHQLLWRGYLPADQALARLDGALAGLSLLGDTPNYRRSMPTKILEYCAYGVPVITTPLPLPARLVAEEGVGVVVPWQDPAAVVDAVLQLRADSVATRSMAERGRRLAADEYDWRRWSRVFLDEMESVADGAIGVTAGSRVG